MHSFLVPSLSLRFLAPLSLGPGADCSFRKLCIWWRPWARAMQEFRRGPCHHRVRPSSLAIVGGGLAPRCPGQAPEASPPPPIGSVPRVVRHVGSGAAQHPGATVKGGVVLLLPAVRSKSETVGRTEKQYGIQSVAFARPGARLRVRLEKGGGRAPVVILAEGMWAFESDNGLRSGPA